MNLACGGTQREILRAFQNHIKICDNENIKVSARGPLYAEEKKKKRKKRKEENTFLCIPLLYNIFTSIIALIKRER